MNISTLKAQKTAIELLVNENNIKIRGHMAEIRKLSDKTGNLFTKYTEVVNQLRIIEKD